MKTAADKDPSNNLKSNMLILGFILGNMKKSADGEIWVAKGWDKIKELSFSGFLRIPKSVF